jgi:hypothetical protein
MSASPHQSQGGPRLRRLRRRRPALALLAGLSLITVFIAPAARPAVAAAAVPSGSAGINDGPYELAFRTNTNDLYTSGSDDPYQGLWNLGMMPGTSAAAAQLPDGNYEVAVQANTGCLWTWGADRHGCWDFGMMGGTSPAITALPDGTYEAAAQASTSKLWTLGTAGITSWGFGMNPASSPSITTMLDGHYELAFQANTGQIWTAGEDLHANWGPATSSPSIASLATTYYPYMVAYTAGTSLQISYPSWNQVTLSLPNAIFPASDTTLSLTN